MDLTNQREEAPKLPADEESERVVLGAIIAGHDQTGEAFELTSVDDFDDSRNQVIYVALDELYEAGQPLDLPGLMDHLTLKGDLDRAGGVPYLSMLGEGIHSRMRVDRYATNIRRARVRREFIKDANRWVMSIMEGERPEFILDEAQDRIAKLAMLYQDNDTGTTFKEAAMSMAADILNDKQKKPLLVGIPGVDNKFGGFHGGELSIITAQTGTGKTHLALQIARNSCKSGRHILYASGEMLAGHLMKRVLASNGPIEYVKMRIPEMMNMYDRTELMVQAADQCKICRVLDKELSLRRIRAACRMLKGHLGGLIVDYDELVEVRGKDEWEMQRILVRSLKSLCMELDIPCILVSQLSKTKPQQQGQAPTLQSLYGSSAKAKHASSVLYVDRPFVQDLQTDEAEASIYVLKSRDGRMGKTECRFDVKKFIFKEVTN